MCTVYLAFYSYVQTCDEAIHAKSPCHDRQFWDGTHWCSTHNYCRSRLTTISMFILCDDTNVHSYSYVCCWFWCFSVYDYMLNFMSCDYVCCCFHDDSQQFTFCDISAIYVCNVSTDIVLLNSSYLSVVYEY